jgi:hypothetical protein
LGVPFLKGYVIFLNFFGGIITDFNFFFFSSSPFWCYGFSDNLIIAGFATSALISTYDYVPQLGFLSAPGSYGFSDYHRGVGRSTLASTSTSTSTTAIGIPLFLRLSSPSLLLSISFSHIRLWIF